MTGGLCSDATSSSNGSLEVPTQNDTAPPLIEERPAGPETDSSDSDDMSELFLDLIKTGAVILGAILVGEALDKLSNYLSGGSNPDIPLDEVEKEILASN